METGCQRWNVLGCYISSKDASTIEDIVADISGRPRGSEMLVSGELTYGASAEEEAGCYVGIPPTGGGCGGGGHTVGGDMCPPPP